MVFTHNSNDDDNNDDTNLRARTGVPGVGHGGRAIVHLQHAIIVTIE